MTNDPTIEDLIERFRHHLSNKRYRTARTILLAIDRLIDRMDDAPPENFVPLKWSNRRGL